MDSTPMRTRLFVFIHLFVYLLGGLNNHFLLYFCIFALFATSAMNLNKNSGKQKKQKEQEVSKRRASKLRLKTARKSRLILNKSWIRDKLPNYAPFDFLPGSPLPKKSRKYPPRKYLSRIYPSRKYLTLLSSCPHQDRGLQLTGGVPTQRIK